MAECQGITLLVVDDQAMVREAIATMLGLSDDFTVIGQASSGEEAVELAAVLLPDVVLMDVSMPGMGGIAAARTILSTPDAPAILALSTFADAEEVTGMVSAGAGGYITKDSGLEQLTAAIRAVALNGRVFDEAAIESLMADSLGLIAPGRACPDLQSVPALGARYNLTKQEVEVWTLIAHGYDNTEISERLFIALSTVKSHINHLFSKLQVGTRREARALFPGTDPVTAGERLRQR
ncbi:response regulator transcription factor [Klugiella xanthotipulae]|uniref:DNA-binding NarL/FixJ family response regulator n=1 Tax=Klugiella xanthotipulae TaxID=244735 RepID=A0A543HYQ3_9MICO|nr:DNA-binding NarL/FixJ family response regulator [Klugiella xanthotipulae]